MYVLIDEAYKVCGAKYIPINKRGKCYWYQACGVLMNIDSFELVAMILST